MAAETIVFVMTCAAFFGFIALAVVAARRTRRRRPPAPPARSSDSDLAETAAAVNRSYERRFGRQPSNDPIAGGR